MRLLRFLWSKWKILAHKIGVFQSKVILTLFYFIFLTPFGIIFTFFKDGLKIKKTSRGNWIEKKRQINTIEDLREQY